MSTIQANQVLLPLLLCERDSKNHLEISGFIGSATIIGNTVCTCSHVIESIDFKKNAVISRWNPSDEDGQFFEFSGAKLHPKYDFATLQTNESPPLDSLPLSEQILDMGPLVRAIGFHDDGYRINPDGRKMFQVAPRSFFGNVVRVYEVPSNKSPSQCELSFPTLSGFSGAPVFSNGFDSIVGMIYGNIEQKIQVYENYELVDGEKRYSETVNRILELGLFHSTQSIKSFLADLAKK